MQIRIHTPANDRGELKNEPCAREFSDSSDFSDRSPRVSALWFKDTIDISERHRKFDGPN